MTDNFKDRQIDFQFDDISDDVTFEGCDDVLTEEFMTNLMKKIRGCEWFIEGNKTEGTITFQSDIMFSVDWVVKTMGDDWDTDEEEEYSQDVILNIDDTQYKVINW
jgi:hypothetical protein